MFVTSNGVVGHTFFVENSLDSLYLPTLVLFSNWGVLLVPLGVRKAIIYLPPLFLVRLLPA